MNQGSDSVPEIFSNRDNVRAPSQYRGESQFQHLKKVFHQG